MDDRYRSLRELPFDVVAGALGVDLGKFRRRKGGTNGRATARFTVRRGTARRSAIRLTARGTASRAARRAGAQSTWR